MHPARCGVLGKEGERAFRDDLSALDEAAGITERTKLKGQAKTGIVATARFQQTMVLIIEAAMADQGVVVGGQGKEILPFSIRQNHAARHRHSICH